MSTPNTQPQRGIEQAKAAIEAAVRACATELGMTPRDVMPIFDAKLRVWMRSFSDDGAFAADGRSARWRVRVRLYRDDQAEPLADSDPDLPADKPGTEIIEGLPAVAEYVAELGGLYHQGPCAGLDAATLKGKLRGLRPTLSRRGGNGVWRRPYTAPDGFAWLARVDIERVSE